MASVVQPHGIALGNQHKGAAEFFLDPVLREFGHLVAAPGDGQILSAFSRAVQENDQRLLRVKPFGHKVPIADRQLGVAGYARQEPLRLGVEGARRPVEHQALQRVVPFAEGAGQGHPVIVDRIDLMAVDASEIRRQGRGAFPQGAEGHLQRREPAGPFRFFSAHVTGIDGGHGPVAPAGNKLVPLDEALRQLHLVAVLFADRDMDGKQLRLQLLRPDLPGHAQHQLGHIGSEIRNPDHLII